MSPLNVYNSITHALTHRHTHTKRSCECTLDFRQRKSETERDRRVIVGAKYDSCSQPAQIEVQALELGVIQSSHI